MRPFLYLILSAAMLPAGVVLDHPSAHSAFYDGATDYFYFDGTGVIAGVSSAPLPEANGLTSQKIFGQATLAAGNYAPYIVLIADGTASGTFTADTLLAIHFDFTTPGLAQEIPFFIQGELGTSNGYYYTEWGLLSAIGGSGFTEYLAQNGGPSLIPAGTEVYSWSISVGAGSYGSGSGPKSLTLNIPANSIELVAFPDSNAAPTPPTSGEVPEPATVVLIAAGLAVLVARRLRHPA